MFQNSINLFFPPVCAGCNSLLLANEAVICTICRHNFPLTYHHLNPENEVFKRFYGRVPLEYASALFYFEKKGIVQQLIHNLKYKGQEEIGTILGQWYAEDLKKVAILKSVDAIIPVPLHEKKFKARGYNQITKFGESLSKELNITYNPHLLVRDIYAKTQSKKSFSNRNEAAKTVFEALFTEKDRCNHFLLIDDVITTGATLEACSHILLKIPNAKISMVCIAMTH